MTNDGLVNVLDIGIQMGVAGGIKLSVWGLSRPAKIFLELPNVTYLTLFHTLNICL